MSDERYPFGSDYPTAAPVYPEKDRSLPSPVLPATAAQPYPSPTFQPPQPFSPANPYGPAQPYPPYGRPPAPSIALTLVITLFFSVFGLIPAFLHSEEAKRNGYPTSKYWVTFGVTLGAQAVLGLLFFVMVIFGLALIF